MTTETKTPEIIEVIDMDQFLTLDAKLQEKILLLTKELNVTHISLFNPLVKAIIDIEQYRKIKFKKDDPESIQAYKDAASTIRTFRATVKKTSTAIKQPLIKTGKDVAAVRDLFIDDATGVEDYLKKEFKPYLDEMEAKKVKAQEKKDKKKNDQISELSAEAVGQKTIIERMNIKNKFDNQIRLIVDDATEQSATFSKEALEDQLRLLGDRKLELSLSEEALLLEDQVEEIEKSFQSAVRSATTILKMKIETFSEKTEEPSSMIAPTMADSNPNFIRDSLINAIDGAVVTISNLSPATEREVSAVDSAIKGLNNYIVTIKTFFKKD